MNGPAFFLLLMTLPLLVVLGHDGYLYYENQDKGFMLTSLGFLWTHYEVESYKWVVENTEEETWAVINELLTFKAAYVTGALAGFFYILFGCLWVLGIWPFMREKAVHSRGR